MISKAILKSQIPHGMFKKVAEKAGVSTPAVTKFFNNQTKSSFKIHKAALEIANECRKQLSSLEQQLSN